VLESALLPLYSTKRSGTGLGLPLSREIVEAHSGRLSLSNRSDGGLEVTLRLPPQPATLPAESHARALAHERTGET
jgi:two-component system nitrogen regulation sensor histidine kinase NtrY